MIDPGTGTFMGALPPDALPEPEPLTFDEWWDSGKVSKDNPYRANSPAFWAYEGWKAAQENN